MPARSKLRIRPTIPITLALGFAVYAIVPEIIRARAEARASMCQNLCFNHSGSHVADVVWLDGDFHVTGVSSCPLCSHPDAELDFVVCKPGMEPAYGLTESDVPQATVDQARLQLYSYKATPRYHALRKRFSTPGAVAQRDWVFMHQKSVRAARAPDSTPLPDSPDSEL